MKKLFLTLLILLLSGVLIAPKIISLQVREDLAKTVAYIDNNPLYSAKISEISSDWFNTTAKIEFTITLNLPQQDPANQPHINVTSFSLDFTAEHGPIVLIPQPSLAWLAWHVEASGKTLRSVLTFADNAPLYQISSSTDLLGWSSFTDSLQPFTVNAQPASVKGSFSGWKGSGTYSPVQFSYHGVAESLTFNSTLANLEIKNTSINLDAQASLADIFAGMLHNSFSQLRVDKITLVRPLDSQQVRVDDFQLTSTSTVNEGNTLANLELAIAAKSVRAGQINAQELQLNLQLNHLNGEFFKAYQVFLSDMQALPSGQELPQLQAFLQQHLLVQLQASPELNISKLQGKLGQGEFSAQLHTKIVAVDTLPAPLFDRHFWLAHLLADASVTADEAVVGYIVKDIIKSRLIQETPRASAQELNDYADQQTTAIIEGLTGNVLTATATGYKLDLSLADGQATLNGQSFPLP